MFKINDYIMYSTVGVCQVIDIKDEKIMNVNKSYYVLNPIYSKNTVIKIPVDNDKISMRRIHSKSEVEDLINGISEEKAFWIDNDKERNEQFKIMLKSGECSELIALVKSIYINRNKKKLIGKKPSKSDDDIMVMAEKLIHEEFAIVLDILPEEVPSYIEDKIAN